MYSMKEVCQLTGFSYETLKFYCNEGLVPNVKRDKGNRRVFDERDVAWIKDLRCLKNCRMSLKEMKQYLNWCLQGPASLEERQEFLTRKKEELEKEIHSLQENIEYIDWKKNLYADFQSGKIPYVSNLIAPPAVDD